MKHGTNLSIMIDREEPGGCVLQQTNELWRVDTESRKTSLNSRIEFFHEN